MSIFAALIIGSSTPLEATAAPDWAFGSKQGAGVCFTQTITVTAVGGVAPYTYAWSYVSGDTTFTADSPTSHVSFFHANVGVDDYKETVWKCRVTDSASATADAIVTLSVQETSFN